MIIYDESHTDYHANPAIGSTLAKLARKSLRLFADVHTGLAPAIDRPAFQVGRIIHLRVLEPDRYAATVKTEGPINEKTGKSYGRDTQAFAKWQAENPEIIVVDPFMDTMCERMPDAIKDVFRDGKPEVSIRTEYNDFLTVQARPDWLRGGDIWDLKTIDDVDKWEGAVRRLDYWFSAGWYQMTMRADGLKPGAWRWIFAEKSWPYRWRVVRMSQAYLDHAHEEACKIADALSVAFEEDDWGDDQPDEIVAELPTELTDQEFSITSEGQINL
jgi:hypothetical protein